MADTSGRPQSELSYAKRRGKALLREREPYESHYRDLSDFIQPRRSRFLTNDRTKGSRRNNKIIDSTGNFALRILESGMQAGITSPARPWFRLGFADPQLSEQQDVKQWLYRTEFRMREILGRSNFYNATQVTYGELATFGTGLMSIEEDFDDVIYCYPFTVGEYSLVKNERGRVVGYFREFSLTVDNLVAEYGKDNLCPDTRQLFENGKLDQWVDVCHLVEPNKDRNYKSPFAQNKPWRSWTWEKKADEKLNTFLRRSGHDEFPAVSSRWSVLGTDIYGSDCPGMVALGDIKQLQMEQRRKGQAIDKQVNPPMIAHPSLQGKPASILPGAVTYLDAKSFGTNSVGFEPAYQVNLRLDHMMNDIREVQDRVNRAFYADLFQMISQMDGVQPRNDLEMLERKEEKLIQLGPVLESLHYEFLNPAIDRVFSIMERKGLIEEPPQAIAGTPMKVEYISLLAQAQKAVGVKSLSSTASFIGNLAQFKPEVLDKFDADQAVDEFAEMVGAPPKVIISDDDVAKARQQRQQQVAQQQAMVNANAAAQSAKTLSEANTEGGNALSDMLGR